jgi:hypothetical protein
MKKQEFIEECWFIYGFRVGKYFFGYPEYHSAGTSGNVEFSWEKAMNPLLIGWVHTHPNGFGPRPSETDNSTMRGWVRGKGKNKSLICGILCEKDQGWFDFYRGSDGEILRRDLSVNISYNYVWGKIL